MKKVLAITIMAALLLGVSVAVMADASNWQMVLKATDLAGSNFNVNTSIGCQATFTDANDGTAKGEMTAPSSPGGGSTIATVAALNGGSLVTRDFKAPITAAKETKTWTIKLYALTNGGPALSGLKLTVTPSASVAPVYMIQGVAYEYTFAADFIAGGSKVFNAANPMPSSFFFEAGYVVDSPNAWNLTITAAPAGTVITPEPSSMVALASGLFGLVGFGIRRRK